MAWNLRSFRGKYVVKQWRPPKPHLPGASLFW
jgi:hypothetical protein